LTQGMSQAITLNEAYAICRGIAKREAKNFYYAFVALPEARRNAICAVYAFMRKADDLSDDESLSREERRQNLEQWQSAWHLAADGGATSDPVFIAVRDATKRFGIPLELLDELIAGTTSDLKVNPGDAPDTYPTFADLYQYCYLVASVVGLVCIRIFGYTDKKAEKLAEETGVAFQLTNILRDIPEDAERGRVYLPLEDLAAHVLTPESIQQRAKGASPSESERALIAEIATRAERYYQSAQELLPLIDRESRPALWVLVEIYHALLRRIEEREYDVFSERASVPTAQKLLILARGMTRMGLARLSL
jgi:15-cis-phytoene synthase